MGKKSKRIFRQASPAERKRIAQLQLELDRELPEIKSRARQIKQAHRAALDAIAKLREERERQGLSLADIRLKSGIGREALCKLENDSEPNPTVRSLARYASALGMGIEIRFVKSTASPS